jgi:hypothetical protein
MYYNCIRVSPASLLTGIFMCRVGTHSSLVIVFLSFKSAPAQKLASDSLCNITARVAPCGPSSCTDATCRVRSASSAREMALREAGLLSPRMRMLPQWGAGIERLVINGVAEVLLWRREGLKLLSRRGEMDERMV